MGIFLEGKPQSSTLSGLRGLLKYRKSCTNGGVSQNLPQIIDLYAIIEVNAALTQSLYPCSLPISSKVNYSPWYSDHRFIVTQKHLQLDESHDFTVRGEAGNRGNKKKSKKCAPGRHGGGPVGRDVSFVLVDGNMRIQNNRQKMHHLGSIV